MANFKTIADRKKSAKATLDLVTPGDEKIPFTLHVEFYLNKVLYDTVSNKRVEEYLATLDTERYADVLEEDESGGGTSWKNAIGFCDFMKSWDLTGLTDIEGNEILDDDTVIPLEPVYIRYVPAWLTNAINARMLELVFPKANQSGRGRRR